MGAGAAGVVRSMAAITADLVEGYKVVVTNDRHTWSADEPLDLGGSDTGPTPYEMLLGSVAACTMITLSMYASRRGLTLDSISVRYEYDRVHVDDCENCETTETGFLDRVRSEIFVEGDFDEEARARLADIAQRCPVHKTLQNGVFFDEQVIVG